LNSILSGMNLTRSYVEIVEDKPRYEEIKVTRVSPTRVSPSKVQQHASPTKIEENNRDWSFVADGDILMKELDLGRDLLNKATAKISAEHLKEIHSANSLTHEDKELIQVMHGLVDVAADKNSDGEFNWEQTNTAIGENPYKILHNLKTFSENVQNQNL